MTAVHARAARRERQAAGAVGGQRIARQRGRSTPDVGLVRLDDGRRIQIEVKSRLRVPAWATSILAQARRYARSAVPIGVIYGRGDHDGVAILHLSDLVALLGLDARAVPTRPRRVKGDGRQLELITTEGT